MWWVGVSFGVFVSRVLSRKSVLFFPGIRLLVKPSSAASDSGKGLFSRPGLNYCCHEIASRCGYVVSHACVCVAAGCAASVRSGNLFVPCVRAIRCKYATARALGRLAGNL